MAGFLGKIKGTMRGGAGAGRGDNPHYNPLPRDPFVSMKGPPDPFDLAKNQLTSTQTIGGSDKLRATADQYRARKEKSDTEVYDASGVNQRGYNQHGQHVPTLKREAAKTQKSYSYGSVRPPQGTREGDLQASYVNDKWNDFK